MHDRLESHPRRRRGGVAATSLLAPLVLLLAACVGQRPSAVPPGQQPDEAEAPVMLLSARGVQIYECLASKKVAGGYEWAFVAPGAELFDAHGKPAGTHGVGPSWQANDGSRIVGVVKERVDAPAPGAIPWLLLAAKSVGPEGALSRVTSIQRVNTAGGLAPAYGCTSDAAGTTVRIPYTADYRFFTQR